MYMRSHKANVERMHLIRDRFVGGIQMEASVTWAKFGVKSLGEYKWNVIQEEVGPTCNTESPI